LIFTWLSLGLAGLAYSQHYQPGTPFLKEWSDGFSAISLGPLHLPALSFIQVALGDAALIFLLLCLTWAALLLERQAQSKAGELRPWFEKECQERIQEAIRARSLVAQGADEKPAWADMVLGVLDHLESSVSRVEALTRTSQEELGRSVARYQGALHEQTRAVVKFEEATTAMHRGVDNLNTVYQAGRHIYRGLNGTLPEIRRSVAVLATNQDKAATALQSIEVETERAAKSVNSVAQQFTEAGLVQLTAQAAEVMRQAADDMRSAARQLRIASNDQLQLQKKLELRQKESGSGALDPQPRTRRDGKKSLWSFWKKS
jgi:hypothetical protein